jgi:hypothetical protein
MGDLANTARGSETSNSNVSPENRRSCRWLVSVVHRYRGHTGCVILKHSTVLCAEHTSMYVSSTAHYLEWHCISSLILRSSDYHRPVAYPNVNKANMPQARAATFSDPTILALILEAPLVVEVPVAAAPPLAVTVTVVAAPATDPFASCWTSGYTSTLLEFRH